MEATNKGWASEGIATGSDETSAVRFNCKSWKSRALEVFDDKSNNIICTIDTKFRKPNLIFKHGNEGETLGLASYKSLSSKIEIEHNGNTFEMKLTKFLGSSYAYDSPSFSNATLTWKSGSGWKNIDYVLMDEQSMPVAKISAPYFSSDFSGRLEFIESRASSIQAKEEILIGAFALVYMTIQAYYAAVVG